VMDMDDEGAAQGCVCGELLAVRDDDN
jgi:hypothetical protein